jgi:APA family basic amino acid/polyamine antiporter
VLFSLWVAFAAGYAAVYQAMVVVLAGIILYAFARPRPENPEKPQKPGNRENLQEQS